MDPYQFALAPISVIAVFAGLAAALFLQTANRPMGSIWSQVSYHWLFAASFFGFLAVVIGPTTYAFTARKEMKTKGYRSTALRVGGAKVGTLLLTYS